MTTRRCYEVQGHVDHEGYKSFAVFSTYGKAKMLRDYLKSRDAYYDSIRIKPKLIFKTLAEALAYEKRKAAVHDILRLRSLIKDGNTHVIEMDHNKKLLAKYKDQI